MNSSFSDQEAASAPRVRVVVVNFNGGTLLADSLASLTRQTISDFEVIVVDNGSEDGSLGGVPSDPRFRVIELGRNTGFAAANNAGMEMCEASFMALLNPDAFAAHDWLEALLEAAQRYPDATMFGSLQINADDDQVLDGTGDNYSAAGTFWRGGHREARDVAPRNDVEVFGPCAAAAMYRREAIEAVAGFDEDFFCYAEDVDLAFRLRLMGGRCIQVANAVARHVGSATAGRDSDFCVYHLTRNQVWTFVKCMPGPLLVALTPIHIAMLGRLWWKMRETGQSAVVARALKEAITGLPNLWAKRLEAQRRRTVKIVDIARALVWNPKMWAEKAIVSRPVDAQSDKSAEGTGKASHNRVPAP